MVYPVSEGLLFPKAWAGAANCFLAVAERPESVLPAGAPNDRREEGG